MINRQQLRNAREVFEAAVPEIGPAREAILARCNSDSELRATVERMLAADDTSHTVLDGGAALPGDLRGGLLLTGGAGPDNLDFSLKHLK